VRSSQQVTSEAFSNIAFVKYWGKFARQYPLNPSISMLIPQCKTSCIIDFTLDETNPGVNSFLFENKENELFKHRIVKYLKDIEDIYFIGNKLSLSIQTENNFPHSAGIASSAFAFAAIAKALVEIEKHFHNIEDEDRRASILARLASGSACRSVSNSEFSIWGETRMEVGSNDFSTSLSLGHEQKENLGWPLLDTILVVDSKQKSVSSSEGHSLMNTHLYKDVRINQAHENLRTIYSAINNGDLKTFGEIIENEALTLHALMMTSYPSFCLLHPNSLAIIELIKSFRNRTDVHLYFTIDAGPNMHLIYPEKEKAIIDKFINEELKHLTESVMWGVSHES